MSSSSSSAARQARRDNSVFAVFNRHATACVHCRSPLEVVRRGDQLCDDGHRIAQDVAVTLYRMAGEHAERYNTHSEKWTNLLYDFTDFNGPVFELAKAMDRGLTKYAALSSSPPQRTAVHYVHTNAPSPASSSRTINTAVVEKSSSSRRSGSIRINVPVTSTSGIEYGKEAHEYEEFTHSNGGRVTTKYYHTADSKPRLIRANSVGDATPRSGKRKGVHFDDEVRCVEYYP